MCKMDNSLPRLPLHLLIFLAFCVCGLMVHFTAENLRPNSSPVVFELAQQGGHALADQESGEDVFVMPCPACMSSECAPVPPVSLRTPQRSCFLNSPLLPPPNS
jgi:hypothetical protein